MPQSKSSLDFGPFSPDAPPQSGPHSFGHVKPSFHGRLPYASGLHNLAPQGLATWLLALALPTVPQSPPASQRD